MSRRCIYIVKSWIPFPDSEYGGLQIVIGDDDEEVVQFILDGECEYRKTNYANIESMIREVVFEADRWPVDSDVTGVVEEFVT